MKVSLITCTFNSVQYIKDCLVSIKNQTYQNIEHIIIDGGSSDNTLKIAKRISPSNTNIISEKDLGPYDAFNKGIIKSTGDLIGFVHSDDLLASKSIINDIVNCIKSNDADSIYGDLDYVREENITKITRKWKSGNYKKSKLKYGWMPPHPTFFVKKKVYDKCGLFDLTFGTAADYELIVRLLYKFNISTCYLPQTITKMRIGGLSNKSLYLRIKAHLNDWKACKKNDISNFPIGVFLKPLRKIPQFFN